MAVTVLPTFSDETVIKKKGYNVEKLIGQGAFANVYRLTKEEPTNDGMPVQMACKIIDISRAPKEYVQKFLPREIEVLSKINHPHIIHLASVIQRPTKFYIFMRYAEQGDLFEYLLEYGELTERQGKIWFCQICTAIQYLHGKDIAHRDIKCENVLVTNNYNVKLADFGFARFTVDSAGKEKMSQTFCGSLGYAAPEILKGKSYQPKVSDVWSLGVVLFVMLNLCMPFHGNTVKVLYQQQKEQAWRIPSRIDKYLSYQVKSLFKKMMDPNPKTRVTIKIILADEWIEKDPVFQRAILSNHEALPPPFNEDEKIYYKKTANMGADEVEILNNKYNAIMSKEGFHHTPSNENFSAANRAKEEMSFMARNEEIKDGSNVTGNDTQ